MELLVYNKANWMDSLTPEQVTEKCKTNKHFQMKYDSRYQKGDIIEVREDGYWSVKRKGFGAPTFALVCIPGEDAVALGPFGKDENGRDLYEISYKTTAIVRAFKEPTELKLRQAKNDLLQKIFAGPLEIIENEGTENEKRTVLKRRQHRVNLEQIGLDIKQTATKTLVEAQIEDKAAE